MQVISGVYWDKGKREENQDSVAFEQVMTNRGRVVFAVVSDGIGGLFEGQIASGFIVEKLIENFYGQLLILLGKNKRRAVIKRSMLRCFFEINQELNRYAAGRNIRLGATVSALLIFKNSYLTFHLGDSRIYLYGGGIFRKLRQLTRDHSDGGGGLLKCLGSFEFQRPEAAWGRLHGKRGFLLCTDGFIHVPDKRALRDLLKPGELKEEGQIEKRLREMAVYAMQKGEKDNITALYIICS